MITAERITDKYVFFWGSVLSNWYERKFRYKKLTFFNTEQAFMWEKAIFFNDFEIAGQIMKNPDPARVKALGRKVKGFNTETWMIVSYPIMVEVNYAKYSQNLLLKSLLLETEDKILVEASPYDKIWGIGISWQDDACLNEANWKGMNLLGKALMEVRKRLRDEK